MRLLNSSVILFILLQSTAVFASICGRELHVQDAILTALETRHHARKECSSVTASDLTQITRLSVRGAGDILWLQPSDFADLTSLEVVSLQADSLHLRDATTFSQNSKLTEFHLRCFGQVMLNELLFQGLNELRKIYLQWSNPEREPKTLFQNLPSVETISIGVPWISSGLSSRRTQVLSDDMFSGSTNLREIFISSNRYTTVSENTFRGLVNLERLSLANNYLSALPEHVFIELKSLKELNLSRNRLQSLPIDLFFPLKGLVGLNLEYNPSLPVSDVKAIDGLYSGQVVIEQ